VFAAQLTAIFWLGDAKPIPRQPLPGVPTLRLAGPGAADLLAMTDPTLFALPHRQGFSGAAAKLSEASLNPRLEWRDPTPRWLVALAADQLGAAFQVRMATDAPDSGPQLSQAPPQMVLPQPSGSENFAQASTVRFLGQLVGRRLLTTLELPSWTNEARPGELLTNSVVQMAVAADGRPLSVTLLLPNAGSGSTNADQRALQLARSARFEPLDPEALRRGASPLGNVVWGEMVFEWRTLPSPATNPPIPNP
jgi:hypothetical protein